MTLMSLAALALYGASIVSAASAARRSWLFDRPRRETSLWLLIALAFLILLAFRWVDGEEMVRESIRHWAQANDNYRNRREYQAPLAMLVLVAGAGGLFFILRFIIRSRGERAATWIRVAMLAVAGFAPLYAVRLISLHMTDALLYSGPIRLNWVLELGLCGASLICAIAYGETVKRVPVSGRMRRDRH